MSSWEDLMTHILTTTTTVEKIVVYDHRGRPVAVTEGVETSDSEGFALVNCLNDPAQTLTKLAIDNTEFLCIQGIGPTLLGTSDHRHDSKLLVAHQDETEGNTVALIGNRGDDEGSYICVLKKALTLKAQGLLVNPEQLHRQSQQMLPIDLGEDLEAMAAPDGVLVDI